MRGRKLRYRGTLSRLRLKCDGTRAEIRFRLSTKRTSPFKSAGGVSSVDYWQASCAHQPAGFVLFVQVCVLQSCDAYWLPTPFASFPLNSPSLRHRVPSHFNWILLGGRHRKTTKTCGLSQDLKVILNYIYRFSSYHAVNTPSRLLNYSGT